VISIVTDSTSDIEPSRAAELGVSVVPLFVVWGDRSYRDYVDLSRPQFYEMLAGESTLPTTSQPTPAMFEDAFRPLAERGDDILCIVVSSKLSGTINAARAASQRFPDARIEIFDSQSVAGGLGMHVHKAHDMAQSGASMEEILAALAGEQQAQRMYALIADLSHIQRTGRIGKAQAAIGTMMKIVPVLCLKDGLVAAEAQVRTWARAQETMLDLTLQNTPEPARARYLVMHTNAPELAQTVSDKLQARLGGAQPKMLDILEAGPVIAVHGGSGAVGIFSAQD
jgi:DegV family protein with EDD domain